MAVIKEGEIYLNIKRRRSSHSRNGFELLFAIRDQVAKEFISLTFKKLEAE